MPWEEFEPTTLQLTVQNANHWAIIVFTDKTIILMVIIDGPGLTDGQTDVLGQTDRRTDAYRVRYVSIRCIWMWRARRP